MATRWRSLEWRSKLEGIVNFVSLWMLWEGEIIKKKKKKMPSLVLENF